MENLRLHLKLEFEVLTFFCNLLIYFSPIPVLFSKTDFIKSKKRHKFEMTLSRVVRNLKDVTIMKFLVSLQGKIKCSVMNLVLI